MVPPHDHGGAVRRRVWIAVFITVSLFAFEMTVWALTGNILLGRGMWQKGPLGEAVAFAVLSSVPCGLVGAWAVSRQDRMTEQEARRILGEEDAEWPE